MFEKANQNQIMTDTFVARFSCRFGYCLCLFKWLDTINRSLHLFIIVLNAKTYSSETKFV